MINHDTENVLQDEPCNFISKGTFDTIFQDEHITFDPQKEIYYTIILRVP
jgi:iron complex transport system ATP-binding protein